MEQRILGMLVVAATLLAACSSATPARPSGESAPGEPSGPKTLTLAFEGEPGNLVSDMEGGGSSPTDFRLALQHHLAGFDERGQPFAMLASELPDQAKGTWVVRADGTMQTTYTLRPGITWHDGTPVKVQDFIFALTVHSDRDLPIGTPTVAPQIQRIDTPDPTHLVIEWKRTYPFANAIIEEDLGPLPTHLLESEYRESKERFPSLPYWKRDFVGTGPYRLGAWEPGSHLTLRAFDGFYGQRPKIDTVILKFIPDDATVVANLLAGAVDGAISGTMSFTQEMFVKSEWERAGRQPVFSLRTTHWRFLSAQLRPELARPRDVLDVQVRRGLLHAIDRQALVDTLWAGQVPVSDAPIGPDDPKWEWIHDAIRRHAFDQRRAQELLTSVGWRRAADGTMLNAGGERASLTLWTTEGGGEQEIAIVADSWKGLGIESEQYVIPTARQRDRELRASYPAFDVTSIPQRFSNVTRRAYGPECPTEASRWVGSNRGCYVNPVMDRTVDALQVTIDPDEQRRLWRDLVRLYGEELPLLPLFYPIAVNVFRDGVIGVKGETRPATGITWNIQDWDLR